ncbi:MAG TPA: hypothetical protein VFT50_14180 [Baekduia sp.]|nr:hypothetical protein [Baekduia sp.]
MPIEDLRRLSRMALWGVDGLDRDWVFTAPSHELEAVRRIIGIELSTRDIELHGLLSGFEGSS